MDTGCYGGDEGLVFAETGVVGLGTAAWVGGGYAGEGTAWKGKERVRLVMLDFG